MAICQYFLKGACKFGDRCFNEHRRPGVCVCEKRSISIAREQAGICGGEEGDGGMYSALG